MARSVFIGITSAALGLALAASLALPSMAMSPNDYDRTAAPLGSQAEIGTLFPGYALAAQKRRMRDEEALRDLRKRRMVFPLTFSDRDRDVRRPVSVTLPF